MAKTTDALGETELEEKFNGPRERLFEKLFGKIDPKKIAEAEKKASEIEHTTTVQEMIAKRRKITGMPYDPWLGEYNRQKRIGNGKIVTKIDEEALKELKEVPNPIK